MATSNEMIFIRKILNSELTIRKAAKQFGLRRDDFIRRMREAIGDDEASLKQLDLVIMINKMIFDEIPLDVCAKEMNLSVQEFDKKVLKQLSGNKDKMTRYLEYKKNYYGSGSKTGSQKKDTSSNINTKRGNK